MKNLALFKKLEIAFEEFMKKGFPKFSIDEDAQEKDPYTNLLFLDEALAATVLSWLKPGDQNFSYKEKNFNARIKNVEKIIKNYKCKNQDEAKGLSEMLKYLEEIKKLHKVYLQFWKEKNKT